MKMPYSTSNTLMASSRVPRENLDVYVYLYNIETALRELIIDLLSKVDGQKWYRTRLPKDILEKYRKGLDFEKSMPWYRLLPLHPIYYIDFPDLKKIIERDDNWRDAFKKIFGSRKDVIIVALSELEFVSFPYK
jgi:hypothetical protein